MKNMGMLSKGKVDKKLVYIVLAYVAMFLLMLAFRSNIEWVMNQFGYHFSKGTITKILHYAEGGSGVASAIVAVTGVALPAWAMAVLATMGGMAA
ncbi:class IIc cyclic bacteriocin [Companilactobacillus metriopterae]|uniref:class IIc cyclic bacteriocin n=1 Tax=Companilactobacillus metriopterae TaxID=1909267 RepID=UPI00100BEBE0|nr:class IIc cyclic bacteriocin [Companilactobacillus metriopterae]